jgi:succinoglycan biosynthesis protein ExoM
MGALTASVVICTYNRPAMLEAALRSCLRDATRRALPFEIVVADNSVAGHAPAIVARVASADIPVRVVPVAPPNISLARNAGLRAATAPLVAFMDDDLEVAPGWLDALVDALAASGADIAQGPLRPRFPADQPPAWDPSGARFANLVDRPTGSLIGVDRKARPAGFAPSTANSLWRAATCFTDPAPFDPAFGVSGGEDLDLFLRLARRGRRLVWCAEAAARETVPPGRMALSYHRLRALAGGQILAAAEIRNSASPVREAFVLGAKGLAQGVVHGGVAALCGFAARLGAGRLARLATRHGFAAAAGWGKVTWWRRVRLYHMERPPA